MELLNDELTMIMNFNMPIFSACYAYSKIPELDENDKNDIFNKINVEFTGINDMKIILFKDALMNYRTINESKDGVYYLIYRNSDYA